MPKLTIGVNELVNKILMLIDELNSLVRAACRQQQYWYRKQNYYVIPMLDKIHKNYRTCWMLYFNIIGRKNFRRVIGGSYTKWELCMAHLISSIVYRVDIWHYGIIKCCIEHIEINRTIIVHVSNSDAIMLDAMTGPEKWWRPLQQ